MIGNQEITDVLIKVFGKGGQVVIGQAPGRVNLIGEHTDYNDGFVFPMAIDYGMKMAARLQPNGLIRIYSIDYDQTVSFPVAHAFEYDSVQTWSNYIRGVLWALAETGITISGMDITFTGDLPQGAGLSSSAALEVVTALVVCALYNAKIDPLKTALLCQRAENEFVGMKCGIMDQTISLMGKQGHALFLDCRSLKYQHIPFELNEYRVVICQSGVKHELVASEYNKRRQECENGVNILKNKFPDIKALRDVNLEQLEMRRQDMSPVVYQRCHHVVTENKRVLDSAEVLKRGDLSQFGQLMYASHDSLRDQYQVSCPEIDLLVGLAKEIPGVLGARITGGGFGGCTVNLVKEDAIGDFTRSISKSYQSRTHIEPQFYSSTPANGATILNS